MPTSIFLLLLFFNLASFAQINVVNTKGEGVSEWHEDYQTKNDARQKALDAAKINALENAFGTVIIQGNTTYISNNNTNGKVETKSKFIMIGNSAVKGEILEVLKVEYEDIEEKLETNKGDLIRRYVKAKVEVKAKELTEPKLDIVALTLVNPMKNFATTSFRKDNDMYIYFKSPSKGFVTIFLDDNKMANCLLPYQKMPDGYDDGFPVMENKEYILFSQSLEHNYFEDKFYDEDELKLDVEGEDKVLWRVFVIFTKTPLNMPPLEQQDKQDNLTKAEIKQKYSLPAAMNSEDFQRWLIKNQQLRADMQVENILISVEP